MTFEVGTVPGFFAKAQNDTKPIILFFKIATSREGGLETRPTEVSEQMLRPTQFSMRFLQAQGDIKRLFPRR
jgi:hypothetical protein